VTGGVLVDAGPLIAILNSSDGDHQRCVAALKRLPAPLLTTWMPFTEAMHLLAYSRTAQEALLEMVERRALQVLNIDEADVPHVRSLMRKYADLPMDFADATLVALAEELDCTSVFTTARTDFSVYRIKGRKPFRILPSD